MRRNAGTVVANDDSNGPAALRDRCGDIDASAAADRFERIDDERFQSDGELAEVAGRGRQGGFDVNGQLRLAAKAFGAQLRLAPEQSSDATSTGPRSSRGGRAKSMRSEIISWARSAC